METSNENRSLLCIFCLKLIDNSTDDSDNDNTSKRGWHGFFKVIIRQFFNCRALISVDNQEWYRSVCKVISESTINTDDIEPFFENIKICNSCEGVTRRFSDFYHQMKELELRIDWEVGKLCNVMECADKTVSSLEKNDLENNSTFNGGLVTLVEFRNTLKKCCQAYQEIKKKVSVPNVQLTQMIVEDFPLETFVNDVELQITSECIPIILDECSITPPEIKEYSSQPEDVNSLRATSTEVEVMEHNADQQINIEVSVCPEAVYSENDLSYSLPLPSLLGEPEVDFLLPEEEDPLNPPNSSQSNYICTTCSFPFTSKFELFQHNMAYHVGKYFSSVQLRSLSNDQFNHYIINLLETILDTFDNVDEKYSCHFCSDLFPGRQKTRNHLLVKHRPILKEKLLEAQKFEYGLVLKHRSVLNGKLTELQNSSNINMIMNTSRRTNMGRRLNGKNNKKCHHHNCRVCGKVFTKGFLLNQHQSNNHPELFFESSNCLPSSSSENNEQFKNIVRSVLEEQMQIIVPRKGNQVKCGICSRTLWNRKWAKHHLIMRHRIFLANQIEMVQGKEKPSQEIQKNVLEMKETKIVENERHPVTGSDHHASATYANKLPFDCSLCSISFKTRFGFRHHDMSQHIDKYFASANLKFLPNDQFTKSVINLVNNMFDKFKRMNSKYQCSFCSKHLSGRQAARYHLVVKHCPIIKDKLVEVQNSGSVSQNVESSMSNNATYLKRKRGWPKGKSRRELKNTSLKFNFKLRNLSLKIKRGRGRPTGKRVIPNVEGIWKMTPVFCRQKVPKVSRCGRCGKRFANVYTLRTHLKSYCKVIRNTDRDSAKIEEQRLDDSWIADLLEIRDNK